ncbi:hypothetical protein [Bathymodiolus thermophilus thioautotrophic gill symbiont]|nr:hypothetical protein [Bathymodiolus thermophilus thioautotrophic gill symbiont]
MIRVKSVYFDKYSYLHKGLIDSVVQLLIVKNTWGKQAPSGLVYF